MAFNKAKLALDLENAFKISQSDPSKQSQRRVAEAIANAIFTYYREYIF